MTTPDAFRDAEYLADVSSNPYENEGFTDMTDTEWSASLRRQDEAASKLQSAAKIALIDRCLRDLDILIYCELSALYYMDCSAILFAIRATIQLIFFTPKAIPFEPSRNQPFIGAIFASNLFCMLAHNFFSHPQAGEAMRGYLHGGLFIDFIGQKTPISVFRLLSLDAIILMIDIIMMGLIIERVKTVGRTSATADSSYTTSNNAHDVSEQQHQQQQQQDYDSEERGVRRNNPGPSLTESSNDDEHTRPSIDARLERTELLAGSSEHGLRGAKKDSHVLDMFSSGDAVILDIGLINIVRDQWRYSPAGLSRRSSPYVPSDGTAALLRERLGLHVTPDGRVTRVGR